MGLFTIDIETLPSNRSEPVESEERAQFLAESLDGARGRILCLSFVDELGLVPEEGVLGWSGERFTMDECKILEDFWLRMRRFNVNRDRMVGHNILGFDLPFIYKRSRILGVEPTRWLSMAKYRSQPVYDTMREFDCWNWGPSTSLDSLARAMGLEGKGGGIDGSKVYDYWRDGRHQELRAYSMGDAILARQVYGRLVFEAQKFLRPITV